MKKENLQADGIFKNYEASKIFMWATLFLEPAELLKLHPLGGYVKEYQVDVNPTTLQVYGISLNEVYQAVRESNAEVGARTIELYNAAYLVRGLGYIKALKI